MTDRGRLKQRQPVEYSRVEPLPNPSREPDMNQRRRIRAFDGILVPYFAGREDVLVSGGGYLRDDASKEDERFAPDCMVAFGVEDPDDMEARNCYVIAEVGKPPDFVLEVGSRSTGRQDYTVKRDAYLGYGVPEYWRFDHTGGRYQVSALAGDVLVAASTNLLRSPTSRMPWSRATASSRVVLSAVPGYRESAESWSGVLTDLRQRGPGCPRLVAGDGHPGIWGALLNVYPDASDVID